MQTLSIDIETFSTYDLKKTGVHKYVECPQFTILMLSYAIDDGDVITLDFEQSSKDLMEWDLDKNHLLPSEVLDALFDPNVLKTAYNAPFERTCMAAFFGEPMPAEQWECTQVKAAMVGLPMGLDNVAKAMRLPVEKDAEGKALIKFFSTPCKPTKVNGMRTRNLPHHDPVKWQKYLDYNKQDVVVETTIRKRLAFFTMPEEEKRLWVLDQKINDLGVLIDEKLVRNCIKINEENKEVLLAEALSLTNLDNPNSAKQLQKWLSTEMGEEVKTLKKTDLPGLIAKSDDKIVKRVIEIRQELSKTSITKYVKMLDMLCADGRVKGLVQCYGAGRTGRFAGRGIQIQNFKKNSLKDIDLARSMAKDGNAELIRWAFGSVSEILSQLLRTALVAPKGSTLVPADFSAIEARVIAWLAGEGWRIKVFNTHGKIYEASASQMFKVPVENIVKGNPAYALRAKGKVAELACIAKGQLVLTDSGLVPIEKISILNKVWDGLNFVTHEGLIFKGYKKTLRYDGLTATFDHLVFIEGQQEPVTFGHAAATCSRLQRTGDGGENIRISKNNSTGKVLFKELDKPTGIDGMHGLQSKAMDILPCTYPEQNKRLSNLQPTTSDTQMAGQAFNSGKTTLSKPKRQRLPQLWGQGHKVQFQQCVGSRAVYARKVWYTGQKIRSGQDRQQRKLRSWQPSFYYKASEPIQPKVDRFKGMGAGRLAIRPDSCNPYAFSGVDQGPNFRKCKNSGYIKKKELAQDSGTVAVFDILNAGPNHRFTISNVLVHNCGYQGGPNALIKMGALEMGLKEKELPAIIKMWRNANPAIVQLWQTVNDAALRAVKTGEVVAIKKLLFFVRKNVLWIKLPSGRSLAYLRPLIQEGKFGEIVTYEGMNQTTRKWERQETYGGKLVENIVQAIARDCLTFKMLQLDDAGFKIVMHIHDEIVPEVPLDEADTDIVNDIMGEPIPWCLGLPLKAESYTTTFYKKDD